MEVWNPLRDFLTRGNSTWREACPCLYRLERKRGCPMGKNCEFSPSSVVYAEFIEISDCLQRWHNSRPLQIPPPPTRAIIPTLSYYLGIHGITLKREKCNNPRCMNDSDCEKAHSITELFVQFNHSVLLNYFRELLGEKSLQSVLSPGQFFYTALYCYHCNYPLDCREPWVQTHSLKGELLRPSVQFQCHACDGINSFAIYQCK